MDFSFVGGGDKEVKGSEWRLHCPFPKVTPESKQLAVGPQPVEGCALWGISQETTFTTGEIS